MFEDLILVNNQGAGTYGPVDWSGGIGTFKAKGTWAGGSAKLQALLPDAVTYADLTDVVLSADGFIGFELSRAKIKCVVTTATAVYASIGPVSP